MKNLFFKEIKLAFHPIIWVFMFAFPFMILIPNYPLFIAFIYVCSCYPILFLGANKGVQSNDLTYTCLLPIKKSDAVKARMLTVIFIQAVSIGMMLLLSPVAKMSHDAALAAAQSQPGYDPAESFDVGFGVNGLIATIAFALVGYCFYDLIYFTGFYKNGRSVVYGTLVGILVFSIFMTATSLILPLIFPVFKDTIENNILLQVGILAGAIILYAVVHYFIFKISAKRLERVDL